MTKILYLVVPITWITMFGSCDFVDRSLCPEKQGRSTKSHEATRTKILPTRARYMTFEAKPREMLQIDSFSNRRESAGPEARKVSSKVFAVFLFTGILQLSALAVSAPRVSFRCVKSNSTSALILKVRNNGPDRLNQNTTVYYYYRTPASDMSITGSHRLDAPLDKGEVFSIEAGANPQTEITECGCALRPFIPVARTTRKASQ